VIARVEPLTSARALRGPFDYRVGEGFGDVGVGSLLLVPFARRQMLGVVVELAERSEVSDDRLLEPVDIVEGGLPDELVELGLWVAEQYCSTPARGLALVTAPGTGTGARRRTRSRRELVAAVTAAGTGALTDGTRLGLRQRAVLEALVDGEAPAAELIRGAGADHSTLRSLEGRGLLELERAERRRRPSIVAVGAPGPGADDAASELTDAQGEALAAVTAVIDVQREAAVRASDGKDPRMGDPLLLHGVTGSGKTEVYLRAAQAALDRGRSAIVLVPEIALTPQTASRFERRFGDDVAILHSRLSAGERYDEWMRLRRGEARICVGPRSAVFAPVADLGLIVIDEEHDSSYKQEGDPRYDARLVAEHRALAAGAALLAGSATPRPESYLRYRRLVLGERVDGRPLPPVELVGLPDPGAGALHADTRAALEAVSSRGEKAIVLLNRRGWSNFLTCQACGRVWECPNCDVTLVLHRSAGRMSCHHCGHAELVPEACSDCGAVSVARHGIGTERLEQDLERVVDPLPVFRLDADSAGGGVAELLQRFEAAPAGVLVGTQMVAKGHDFPDVTLGVVLDADATLRFPDFRSEERTFALVAQLAGRSGRGPGGGRVIVQALDPRAEALRRAAEHDSEGFLAGELARRELLSYPPYGDLIRVVCSSARPGPQDAAAEAVRERIATADVPVLGPAALFRRKGRDRAQLVVKASEREVAIAAVREAVEAVASERARDGVNFAVDVDPQ